jgi:hypothetical protein
VFLAKLSAPLRTAALVLVLAASSLGAQDGTVTIANPFPMPENDLRADGLRRFKDMPKILIPTVEARFALRGSLFVANQGGALDTRGGTARARGRYVVGGLDPEYMRGLVKQYHDDLVARLRAAGYEVLTYDDVKDLPEVQRMDRYRNNEDYGVPTMSPQGSRNDYAHVFPTEAQAINPPMQGYGWGFRKVARDLDAAVLVPVITIDAPTLSSSTRNGVSSRSAAVHVAPNMVVNVYAQFWTARMAWGSVYLKEPLQVADTVGQIGEATDDSPRAANAIAAGLSALTGAGGMSTASGTYGMAINRDQYTAGFFRAAISHNMLLARLATENKR